MDRTHRQPLRKRVRVCEPGRLIPTFGRALAYSSERTVRRILMNEIIASLVFDSWMESTPELRVADAEDRHLIYEGAGVILDLLLKRAKDGSYLYVGGQVLPGQNSKESVSHLPVLMEQGTKRCYTHTNALGEFTFHSISNGLFDLAITLGHRRFKVRGLSNDQPRMWRVVRSVAVGGD